MMSDPAAAVEVALQPQFLVSCLLKALGDDSLVEDIVEASRLCGMSAVSLGSGSLDVVDVAKKLYLTEEEARAVVEVCRSECVLSGAVLEQGVLSGPGPVAEGVEYDDAMFIKLSGPRRVSSDVKSEVKITKISEPAVSADVPIVIESKPESQVLDEPKSSSQTDNNPDLLKTDQAQAAPEKRRKRNVFSAIGSSLLKPTAAFIARARGAKDKDKDKDLISSTSTRLDQILASPSGKRVTKAVPFQLRTSTRSKPSTYEPTDELQFKKAQEEAKKVKPLPIPKSCKEQRPLEFRAHGTPKKPEEVQRPFSLASSKRHEKSQEEMKKKLEAEREADQANRTFHARPFSPPPLTSLVMKPTPPPTTPQAPRLRSQERNAHYNEVVSPAKKAKEEALAKAAAEQEQQRVMEELSAVTELRKSLVFKARNVPSFAAPFKPDLSKAAAVTKATDVELPTDKRLGKKVFLPTMGKFEAVNFYGSLRSSCQLTGLGSCTSFGPQRNYKLERNNRMRASLPGGFGMQSLGVSVSAH